MNERKQDFKKNKSLQAASTWIIISQSVFYPTCSLDLRPHAAAPHSEARSGASEALGPGEPSVGPTQQ